MWFNYCVHNSISHLWPQKAIIAMDQWDKEIEPSCGQSKYYTPSSSTLIVLTS